ncbi:MAG: hypothetical protein GY754_08045 [bacterium]|nr:hypothetical protein [bacterium]
MNQDKKTPYSTGQRIGMICIILLLAPLLFGVFTKLFLAPFLLFDLLKIPPHLRIHISRACTIIALIPSVYTTFRICKQVWPKRAVTE